MDAELGLREFHVFSSRKPNGFNEKEYRVSHFKFEVSIMPLGEVIVAVATPPEESAMIDASAPLPLPVIKQTLGQSIEPLVFANAALPHMPKRYFSGTVLTASVACMGEIDV